MQTLQDFITDRLDKFYVFENLEVVDEVYDHLCVEYDVHLNEARGIPNGLRDDASYIAREVRKKIASGSRKFTFDVELSKLDMRVFNRLTVDVIVVTHDEIIDGEFAVDSPNCFMITLRVPSDCTPGEIGAEIGHELLHIFTYVQNGTDGHGKSKFLQRLERLSYDRLFSDSETDVEEFVKWYIYISNNDELNAFIAQLTLEVEAGHPRNPEEALRILHANFIYVQYMKVTNFFNYYKEKETRDKLCAHYRNLTRTYINVSDRALIKNIRTRIAYIQRRVNKVLSRVCYENRGELVTVGGVPRKDMNMICERFSREYHTRW